MLISYDMLETNLLGTSSQNQSKATENPTTYCNLHHHHQKKININLPPFSLRDPLTSISVIMILKR